MALGRYPFGFDVVWGGTWAMFHGNSAVAIAGSGNITIRNCDLRNAYHGITVKDRNNGGIFQSSNPNDNDRADQIPLASFGTQGGHLIEYNRIHNNSVGYYSESAWDLASTIRYNLFFDNHHPGGITPAVPGSSDDKLAGAMLFKDQILSPVAIYNNTFYYNAAFISAKMWYGGPHLIFNNIFGSLVPGGVPQGSIINLHPNRMHNNISTNETINEVDIFQSINPASSNFLRPDWNHPDVIAYIKNQGWTLPGILNSDGTIADLGAISSVSAPVTIVARAIPTNVVMINGTQATAEFNFQVYDAATGRNITLDETKIKVVRWVQPIPNTTDKESVTAIPSGSIRDITSSVTDRTVKMGSNRFTFTVTNPGTSTDVGNLFGFFEIVIEGTYQGRTIISDVSFLPYTRLRNTLDIVFLRNGAIVDEAVAGQTYQMRIRANNLNEAGTPSAHTAGINAIEFQLFTNKMSSTLWTAPDPGAAFTIANPGISSGGNERIWDVYFKTAGDESVRATGIGTVNGNRVAFLGIADIKVKPGPAENVTFIVPGPRKDLEDGQGGFAPALPIPLGAPFTVEVGVTDKFGNLIDGSEEVRLENAGTSRSDDCPVIDLSSPRTANTDASGIARFVVNVTCGTNGEWVDMKATATSTGKDDIGRLRVGRTQDRLFIFVGGSSNEGNPLPGDYSPERGNISYWDPDMEVRGAVSERVAIHVKAVSGGAVMERNFTVCLRATDPEIEFYDAQTGGNRLHDVSIIELNDGEGVVWITAMTDVDNASVEAYACGGSANTINAAFPRSNIYFNSFTPFIAVTNISGVPNTATVGIPRTLSGTVNPSDATNRAIEWNVSDAGTTGATITGNVLNATGSGIVTVRAAIANGTAAGVNYTQNFNITVNEFVPVTGIADVPKEAFAGTPLVLVGTVTPNTASSRTIVWSVVQPGTTGATIMGSILHATDAGTVIVKASIANGESVGVAYDDYFIITVQSPQSVVSVNREIPKGDTDVTVSVAVLSGEFTAGPNPALKSSGIVNFYRQGKSIQKGVLTIFDASGNVISKVKIADSAQGAQERRLVGSWDLKDAKGRPVSEGTYLVKGVATVDGKKERVSLMIGVR